MTEFRIKWQRCPHANFPSQIMFVEAANETDAQALATDHIERYHHTSWFTIWTVESYKQPTCRGRVLS